MFIIIFLVVFVALGTLGVVFYDRFFQKKNLVLGNFPLIGRMRYLMHEVRPFVRQYFFDDDDFAPHAVIEWILNVAKGKSGYMSFDKFDTTGSLHDGQWQMIHSSHPKNTDEMNVKFPLIGGRRKNPMQFHSYIYRSAMSLGALSFEATQAMASACADARAPFNTGEGGLAVHHIPRVKFSHERKFFKHKKASAVGKMLWHIVPVPRLRNDIIDWMGRRACGQEERDLYLYDHEHNLFYTIDWDAPLEAFPKPDDLTDDFGQIILQIGSGLYGLRAKTSSGDEVDIDWTRFAKVASFARAVEIKLAQGAKQSGGILKAHKNTQVVSEIRGVEKGIDLVSPNRFPFFNDMCDDSFFDFLEEVSRKSGDKPVGMKIVISDRSNIAPIAQMLAKNPDKGPDFITVDGADGGSGAAPLSMSIMFGKLIYEAVEIVVDELETAGVRDRVKIFASSKLYAPHMSARVLAAGADAIGNARSIMIAAGCIRAGKCSGENGPCPVGIATMEKRNRRTYAQVMQEKITSVKNYLDAHNHELEKVAAIMGVESPHLLTKEHIAKK